MSKLDKLSILGIRSFDNRTSETIIFNTPLTLIVGFNGSGKTTIIECLKYATIGVPPLATNNGRDWIHEPNLCGEKEVLAQIKISYKSNQGAKMVCARNLQLTVKKNARSFSALEGTLRTQKENGEKIAVSTKRLELNTLVPQSLGVSKAILDNVIFCHQDQSLWPLSAPTELKGKFDEIFDALKYTKAIENIKIIEKQKRIELGKFRLTEGSAKETKNTAERDKGRMQVLSEEIRDLKRKESALETSIKELTTTMEDAEKNRSAALEINSKLQSLRITRDSKRENVQSSRVTLQVMEDDDATLKNMLDSYEERVGAYKSDMGALKERYGELGDLVEQKREDVGKRRQQLGSHQAQKESHDRLIENRIQLVKSTARASGMYGYDFDVDNAKIIDFMDTLQRKVSKSNAELEHTREALRKELDKQQKAINHIESRKSSANEKKNAARDNMRKDEEKLAIVREQLYAFDIDEGALTRLNTSKAEVERALSASEQSLNEMQFDSQIKDVQQQEEHVQSLLTKLDDELSEATKHSKAMGQLEYFEKELNNQQYSLDAMKGAHSERIDSIVGPGWQPFTIGVTYQRVVKNADSRLDQARRQHDDSKQQMDKLDDKLRTCRTDLQKKQTALEILAKKITTTMECDHPQDYPEEVRKLENGRDQLKQDNDSIKLLVKYFDLCLRDATEHDGGCRTCKRRWNNEGEKSRAIELIKAEKKKRLAELGEAPEDLAEYETDLKKAREIQSDFDTWTRLRNDELPALRQHEAVLVEERSNIVRQLEAQDRELSEQETLKNDVASIKNTVESIANYEKAIASFKSSISELQEKQKAQGLFRGVEAIHEDRLQAQGEASTAKDKHIKLINERSKQKSAISDLERQVTEIERKLQIAKSQLDNKTRLEKEVKGHKEDAARQRDVISIEDQHVQRLTSELTQATSKYEDTEARGNESVGNLARQNHQLEAHYDRIKKTGEEIDNYVQAGHADRLESTTKDIGILNTQITEYETERQNIVSDVKKLEDSLRNHEETRRGIAENLRYRADLRKLEEATVEIAELEQRNPEEELEYWKRRIDSWRMEKNTKNAECSSISGQLLAKTEQLDDTMKNYEKYYKNAALDYKKALINVETTKACIDDLGKYWRALDQAIMKYHSIKMEEINGIIDELWRKTYQGTDIDTIMIRSENETATSRKSYNYRVVMIKQDTEMEMRGRCSAGQKVLASIIIRLALAECFGVNCGIIALDEPTTNLDQDNIRALAESLAEIIKVRRQQRNFQLIVITHDEEFLRYMQCGDFADTYYRVSRDGKQKSVIKRQNIAQVL